MRLLCPLALLLAAPLRVAAGGKRLRIRNGCSREPIWIAHEAAASTGPDAQNVRIGPNEVVEFQTPDGLFATRYWPKMGCDEGGDHCTLGGSGGPGEACVRRPPEVASDDYSRCAPPVDTKFEGTFGSEALPCKDGVGVQGCDYVDMSLVDGWTLPFKFDVKGSCVSQKGITDALTIDCSGLTFDMCPAQERLVAADGMVVDLRAMNPHTGQVAGCYAPCMKLQDGKWLNNASKGRHVSDPAVAPYCCPTPPETPEACRAGPIVQTEYLKTVHSKCPGVYGYAYDDGMGLLRCVPQSIYELTFFCPDATTSFAEVAEQLRDNSAKASEQKRKEDVAKQEHVAKVVAERANATKAGPALYVALEHTNAYLGHGAEEIDADQEAPGGLSASQCRDRCSSDAECQCVTFRKSDRKCWKRKACDPSAMTLAGDFVVYAKKADMSKDQKHALDSALEKKKDLDDDRPSLIARAAVQSGGPVAAAAPSAVGPLSRLMLVGSVTLGAVISFVAVRKALGRHTGSRTFAEHVVAPQTDEDDEGQSLASWGGMAGGSDGAEMSSGLLASGLVS